MKFKKSTLIVSSLLLLTTLSCCNLKFENPFEEETYQIEGTSFYRKKTRYYYAGPGEIDGKYYYETLDCYYQNGDGICYVDVLSMFNIYIDHCVENPNAFTNKSENGKVTISFIGQENTMQSIVLDSLQNTATISSSNFYTLLLNGGGTYGKLEYKRTISPYTNVSRTINLNDYGLSVYYVDNKVLLPLSIYDLIYFKEMDIQHYYVNNAIYCDDCEYSFTGTSDVSITSEIRELTYNYLRLYLHQFYGLSSYYGFTTVEKVDQYLSSYKTDLLSTNPNTFEAAEAYLFGKGLNDPHTGINYFSLYHDNNSTVEETVGSRSTTISSNINQYTRQRSSATNLGVSTLRVEVDGKYVTVAKVYGTSAIITFDSFEYGSSKTKGAQKEYIEKDLFSYMYYALEEIKKNSNVKNIVVDLTTNTGGYVISGLELLSFMTNDPIVYTYRDLAGGYASETVYVDNDMDGDTTDDDASTSYNWYIETSSSSFSCANLVPYLAKEYGYAKIIGETSGGGMCTVGYGVLPDGTFYQNSSSIALNTGVSGVDLERCCEDGVKPDIALSSSWFYNYYYINMMIGL